ncbi:MAG: TonB-dependent receptor [Bacteroidetes bacterium]|nr:TonB-dependent receptor [Bacteroidota bacterium]
MAFIFTVFVNAQSQNPCNFILQGKVIDEHDKSVLPYAVLLLKEINYSTTSDSAGNYMFRNLCEGYYTIIIDHVGCERVFKNITISGSTTIDFYAEHHTEQLKEIEIKELSEKHLETHSQTQLSASQTFKSSGNALGEMLKDISGVTALQTGSSVVKPVIQGLHSNRILILNNGVRLEGQQWGTDHAPEIDPFSASKITVVKGANSVRYGADAIAGTILVESAPLRDSAGVDGAISTALFSNGRQGVVSGYTQVNFGKVKPLAIRLQGTLKKAGNVNAPYYYLKNTGLHETNFSWQAGWKKKSYDVDAYYSQFSTTIGIFSASHIGNLTDLKKAFESPVPLEQSGFTYAIDRPYQHVTHELIRVKAQVKIASAFKLVASYARQYNLRYEYDKHKPLNNNLAALNKPEFQLELTTHTGDLYFEHSAVRQTRGVLGVFGMMQQNTYEGRFFIPNYETFAGGVYLVEQWQKNKFGVELGGRYDVRDVSVYRWVNSSVLNTKHYFTNVSGVIGISYDLHKTIRVKANSGIAWRAPGVNELYSDGLHHSVASIEKGDTALKVERAYNSSITIEYDCNCDRQTVIQINPYYNVIENFINLIPGTTPVLTIRGAFPVFYYKQVNATLSGVDAQISTYVTKHIQFVAKSSFLQAIDRTNAVWLQQMPANRAAGTVRYHFSDSKKMKNTIVESELLYVNQQWRVPSNADFAVPPSGYFLLGFYFSGRISMGKTYIDIGVQLQNVLDSKYRDYLDRFRYYTDAMGRNVSLKAKIPFSINLKK